MVNIFAWWCTTPLFLHNCKDVPCIYTWEVICIRILTLLLQMESFFLSILYTEYYMLLFSFWSIVMVSYINELNPRQITNHIYFSTLKLLGHVMVFNFRLRVKNQSIAAIKRPQTFWLGTILSMRWKEKIKVTPPTKKNQLIHY